MAGFNSNFIAALTTCGILFRFVSGFIVKKRFAIYL
jgi:hypothetical protein